MTRQIPARRPVRSAAHCAIRGVLAGTVAIALTACGAGNNAVTADFYSPGDGVATVSGSLRVLNALVVAPATPGQPAVVSMTVANDGTAPETLGRVSTDRFGDVTLAGAGVIPPKGTLTFGAPASEATATIAAFNGKAGETVALDLQFSRAAPIRGLRTVITPATGFYSDLVATAKPSPSPTVQASPPQVSPSAPAGSGGANAGNNSVQPQPPRQS